MIRIFLIIALLVFIAMQSGCPPQTEILPTSPNTAHIESDLLEFFRNHKKDFETVVEKLDEYKFEYEIEICRRKQ